MKRYLHLCAFALDHPWAMTPPMLAIVAELLAERLAGERASDERIATALQARKNDTEPRHVLPMQARDGGESPQPRRGGIAIIPAYGVLAPRMNLLSESSGGTSFERLSAHLHEALARADVSTIVFDVDSPGGSVAGAAEFAAELRAARAQKPIIAVANHQMASAAYWIFSNATKVHASPSAAVGSIGVFTIHHDLSEAMAKVGVKRTIVAAGKYKLDGLDGEPLTESALAYREQVVGKSYDRFVADVAKGRSVSVSAVKASYGEGRLVDADDALAAGMVDKVASLDETLDRLLPAGEPRPNRLDSRADTSQEPDALGVGVTDQDRAASLAWQARIEHDLLALDLPTM